MKRSRRRSYFLSAGAFTIASIILFMLIATWPEKLTAIDWIRFAAVVLAWLISFLSFPFMQKVAGIRFLPEAAALPIVLGLTAVFFLIFVFSQICTRGWNLPLPVMAVLVLFGIGIVNIIRHYLLYISKKNDRPRNR